MLIRDVMTQDVVTIPSNTSIADAKQIMKAHKFRRLPVVDKGKLKGIVTEHRVEHVSPSKATSLTVWEIGYLLEKTKVSDIMETKVVTVDPEMEVERALALAQKKQVGSLLVVENKKLVGIVTTNDFFYKIVNKVLGIGESGARIKIADGGEAEHLEEIINTINKHGFKLVTMLMLTPPEKVKKDIIIHLDKEEVDSLLKELQDKDYEVSIRKR